MNRIVVTVVALSACYYPQSAEPITIDPLPPAVVAADLWGPTQEPCFALAASSEIVVLSEAALTKRCGHDYYGCYLGVHDWIPRIALEATADGLSRQTQAHEMVHVISDCETGDPDGSHTKHEDVWLKVREIR